MVRAVSALSAKIKAGKTHPSDQQESCTRCRREYRKYPFRSPKNLCDRCQRDILNMLDASQIKE